MIDEAAQVAGNAAGTLMSSGNLVIAALLFVIGLMLLIFPPVIYVLYRDGKEANNFLRENQLNTLDTLNKMEIAVTATLNARRPVGE